MYVVMVVVSTFPFFPFPNIPLRESRFSIIYRLLPPSFRYIRTLKAQSHKIEIQNALMPNWTLSYLIFDFFVIFFMGTTTVGVQWLFWPTSLSHGRAARKFSLAVKNLLKSEEEGKGGRVEFQDKLNFMLGNPLPSLSFFLHSIRLFYMDSQVWTM